jgi:hypothetical protein
VLLKNLHRAGSGFKARFGSVHSDFNLESGLNLESDPTGNPEPASTEEPDLSARS